MDRVGFVVVGLGMGSARAKEITQIPEAKLVAVVDIDVERARKVSEELSVPYSTDFREFLDRADVDVVMVMTPSGLHAEVGVECARAGKNVLVTKPIEASLERADWLISECEKAGVVLACDFASRFVPDNRKMKYAVENGYFGKLILGEARLKWFRAQSYYEGWHGTWRYDGGGSLINQTIHWMDILLWLMGDVKSVCGKVGVMGHDIEAEDIGLALIEFQNGALGSVLGTTTFPDSLYSRVEIHGNEGGAITENNKLVFWKTPEEVEYDYTGPKNAMEDIIGALREGRKPLVDGQEARKSLELVKAIYKSSFTGEQVTFPLEASKEVYM